MHSFLRAVGFSNMHITEYDMNILLEDIYRYYDQMVSVMGKDSNVAFLEVSRSFGADFGIRVCGELDGHGFHRMCYFPYLKGDGITSKENVAIQMRADGESFTGIVDDGRVGMSLIFTLQNPGDYRRELRFHCLGMERITTTLSALSLSGIILLPIRDDWRYNNKKEVYYKGRVRSVAEAKGGNLRALSCLTLQDLELYARIQRRIVNEDILSIVDTYFMPYGMECDQYRVLGNIQALKKENNSFTGEEVIILTLSCNGMIFDVCINSSDLIGEAVAGRRFKGNVWLQGRVNFSTKNRVESVQT